MAQQEKKYEDVSVMLIKLFFILMIKTIYLTILLLFIAQTKLPLDNLNNARLEGNVLKLLDGYDSKSE